MEFYRNKRKTVNLILICTGVLLVLVVIFLYSIGLFTNTLSAKLAAITGVFSLILAIVIVNKLLSLRDTSPLIILSNEGIIAKVTAVSKAAGLIFWKDIIDISLEKVGGDTLVTLTVDKPDHYIPIIKKKLSAMVVNGIEDANGNLPINLTASELNFDAQELFTVITSFKKEVDSPKQVKV
ncbi:STM3941 family protein [Pedobacter sp. N23S346]|uniref:STM3941 family protein n=1 Tax=Pedobacter sp. N23S346 TaxID=3402750 RepID=UPI003AD09E25